MALQHFFIIPDWQIVGLIFDIVSLISVSSVWKARKIDQSCINFYAHHVVYCAVTKSPSDCILTFFFFSIALFLFPFVVKKSASPCLTFSSASFGLCCFSVCCLFVCYKNLTKKKKNSQISISLTKKEIKTTRNKDLNFLI